MLSDEKTQATAQVLCFGDNRRVSKQMRLSVTCTHNRQLTASCSRKVSFCLHDPDVSWQKIPLPHHG